MSFKVAEPPSLCFNSQQDALDFARNLVKNSANRLAVYRPDLVERYVKNEIEIVVVCRVGTELEEYHLLFCAIPDRINVELKPSRAMKIEAGADSGTRSHRDQHFVFISNGYFIQSPQNLIPTLVRLERPKQRPNVLRDILAPAFEVSLKISKSSREREVCFFGVGSSSSESNSVNSLVQGGSEVVDDIADDIGEIIRHRPNHLHFVNSVTRLLWIWLDDSVVRTGFNECPDFPFEVGDVFLSVCDFSPSAF